MGAHMRGLCRRSVNGFICACIVLEYGKIIDEEKELSTFSTAAAMGSKRIIKFAK